MTDTARFAGERLQDALAELSRKGVRQVRILDMTSKKGEGYDQWRVVNAARGSDEEAVTLWVSRFPLKQNP